MTTAFVVACSAVIGAGGCTESQNGKSRKSRDHRRPGAAWFGLVDGKASTATFHIRSPGQPTSMRVTTTTPDGDRLIQHGWLGADEKSLTYAFEQVILLKDEGSTLRR